MDTLVSRGGRGWGWVDRKWLLEWQVGWKQTLSQGDKERGGEVGGFWATGVGLAGGRGSASHLCSGCFKRPAEARTISWVPVSKASGARRMLLEKDWRRGEEVGWGAPEGLWWIGVAGHTGSSGFQVQNKGSLRGPGRDLCQGPEGHSGR